MRVFVTGASGYIGGTVAARLIARGDSVLGLVRSREKAEAVAGLGIEPLIGTLADPDILAEGARAADAVIHTASSDDPWSAEALLAALEGTGKSFIQTSGSSIVADRAAGEPSDLVFHEDTIFDPLPERLLRVAIDERVLRAAHRGVRSIVLRPGLVYGRGAGVHRDSIQLPKLAALARRDGVVRHVGRGLNRWAHVHIDDLAELFLLALDRAPAGSLFYVESGETAWRDIARAVGRALGLGDRAEPWPIAAAVKEWGAAAWTSFGSNSRVRADKARAMLGWQAKAPGLPETIPTTFS
jgi:nucleoside-diphosphate-sugar epimerase